MTHPSKWCHGALRSIHTLVDWDADAASTLGLETSLLRPSLTWRKSFLGAQYPTNITGSLERNLRQTWLVHHFAFECCTAAETIGSPTIPDKRWLWSKLAITWIALGGVVTQASGSVAVLHWPASPQSLLGFHGLPSNDPL